MAMSPPEPSPAETGAWTIRRTLSWTTRYFQRRGLGTPRLDAELLLADALGATRVELYTDHDRPLEPQELARLREGVRRRGDREPLAYILGRRAFWDLDLQIDARVLVPRPETERLVELALQGLAANEPGRIADVGTGSGAIALAIAKSRPRVEVIGLDRCPEALEVARENGRRCGIDNVEWRQGHLLEPVEGPLDLIVSNPPYVRSADLPGLMAEVACEPRIALDGGADGLAVIAPLIEAAPAHLRGGGRLLIEIGADQASAVRALLGAPEWGTVSVHRDYSGRDRVVDARRLDPRGRTARG